MLRTRHSGSDVLADVHILVDPALSVSEGHQIGEAVRHRLIQMNDDVTDVTVHIDPEDDELASPCDHLPLRNEILRRLGQQWQGLEFNAEIQRVVLHYLDGRVDVDVYLPLSEVGADKSGELSVLIRKAASQAEDVGDVRVYYQS